MNNRPGHCNVAYLKIINQILTEGYPVEGRNGRTKQVHGAQVAVDIGNFGFPIVTARHIYFKQSLGEFVSFANGLTKLSDFEDNGCSFWRKNCESESWQKRMETEGFFKGWLGRIYGSQWRLWRGSYDQLAECRRMIIEEPNSRRILMTSFDPLEIPNQCLPPCHTQYQFLVQGDLLHLVVSQRSLDVMVGLPYDLTLFGLLLETMAYSSNKDPGCLYINVGSAHIYEEHTHVAYELEYKEVENYKVNLTPRDHWDILKPSIDDYTLIGYPEDCPKYDLEMIV